MSDMSYVLFERVAEKKKQEEEEEGQYQPRLALLPCFTVLTSVYAIRCRPGLAARRAEQKQAEEGAATADGESAAMAMAEETAPPTAPTDEVSVASSVEGRRSRSSRGSLGSQRWVGRDV